MRLLLDEGFPSPQGFDPSTVDAATEVLALREFDPVLVGTRTPDWYLYLRADEGQFDALVTGDWHQSEQVEELWVLTQTQISIITWKKAVDDPIRKWGQMLAYLSEVRRMILDHGPSVIFLPSPRLTRNNLQKASRALGEMAARQRRSNQELRDEARRVIAEELEWRGETDRFPALTSHGG